MTCDPQLSTCAKHQSPTPTIPSLFFSFFRIFGSSFYAISPYRITTMNMSTVVDNREQCFNQSIGMSHRLTLLCYM